MQRHDYQGKYIFTNGDYHCDERCECFSREWGGPQKRSVSGHCNLIGVSLPLTLTCEADSVRFMRHHECRDLFKDHQFYPSWESHHYTVDEWGKPRDTNDNWRTQFKVKDSK